jgi:hypothetical protein
MSQTKAQLIDNLVQPITGALGSASAPTFSFTSDPNTGIYSPGADQLAISTSGTGRLFIGADGKLGAGNSDPQAFVTFNGGNGSGFTDVLQLSAGTNASNSGPGLTFNANYGNYSISKDWQTGVIRSAGSNAAVNYQGYLAFYTNNGSTAGDVTEKLRITHDGKLGLGTSSPASLFHIAGGGSGRNGALRFSDGGGTNYWEIGRDNAVNGSFTITQNGTERLCIDYLAGNVGMGTSSPGFPLTVSSLGATFTDNYKSILDLRETSGANKGISIGYDDTAQVAALVSTTASTASQFAFVTFNGSSWGERVRISGAGNVGIGTTSPGEFVELYKASGSCNLRVTSGASSGNLAQNGTDTYLTNGSNGPIQLWTNGNERARIDSSGRLLVGTSSGSGENLLQIQGQASASNGVGGISLRRGVAPASIGSGGVLGQIDFGPNDGGVGASISGVGDAAQGTNDYPSRLVFSTTADGASSPTERMRITNGGSVCINTTDIQSARLSIESNTSALYNATFHDTRAGADGNTALIAFKRDTATVGSISTTSSATAYNTSSDYRLKENVVPLTGAADRLNQLQVHRFNFKADPLTIVDGFIAHEAQAVVPECVTGTKDEVDADGNPVYQGIDQSKLVPLLTAALQEAIAEIGSLKDRVAALEAQ